MSSDAAYTFTVTVERNLVANFTRQTCLISAQVDPQDSGVVTGADGYSYGDECTLTATAKLGYTFVKWTDQSGATVSTQPQYTFTVTQSATFVAHFQTQNYTISVVAQPSNGGTVSGGGTYAYGQSCTVYAVPASGYNFVNWTDDGDIVSTDVNYTITVAGNKSLTAVFSYNGSGNVPEGAINGLFTINEKGDQVYFSQGNLQYQASTNNWRFAENQWDYVGTQTPDNYGNVGGTISGSDNSNISSTYSGWIDLFGWGTSGYNHGAVCYQPWSTSLTDSDYLAYGSYNYNLYDQTGQADWGYNPISNGGNQTNQWRTLTKDEWVYVFNTRSTASCIRYAKSKVNNVKGLILLPDNWSASYYTLSNTNTPGASFSSNTITASQWSTLEQHGAVFLPAAGYRSNLVCFVGSDGYYWSASCSDSYVNVAYHVYFENGYFGLQGHGRCLGQSVRLVCVAQ